MKLAEAQKLKEDLEDWFRKNGLPINIRKGSNEEIAEHILKIAKAYIHIDQPIGVKMGDTYDHCPRCSGVIGSSAFYCKRCGAMIREGGA